MVGEAGDEPKADGMKGRDGERNSLELRSVFPLTGLGGEAPQEGCLRPGFGKADAGGKTWPREARPKEGQEGSSCRRQGGHRHRLRPCQCKANPPAKACPGIHLASRGFAKRGRGQGGEDGRPLLLRPAGWGAALLRFALLREAKRRSGRRHDSPWPSSLSLRRREKGDWVSFFLGEGEKNGISPLLPADEWSRLSELPNGILEHRNEVTRGDPPRQGNRLVGCSGRRGATKKIVGRQVCQDHKGMIILLIKRLPWWPTFY